MNSIVEVEPGVYSVIHEGVSYEVRVCGERLSIHGYHFRQIIDDPRQWKRSNGPAGNGGRANITAPMPGKVVRILVAQGDTVTAGQGIAVVEAMKMQNELKSPVDGVVAQIRVAENEGVSAGAILATIEPSATDAQ